MDLKKWFDKIREIIIGVEQGGADKSGDDKKVIAVSLINSLVDVPFIPEFIEERIISLIVDYTVYMFNTYMGKSWVEKV